MSTRGGGIGADAAGMSAAHQALRTARQHGRTLEVVAVEATEHTSYSACGLPYWIGGDVEGGGALVARGPEEHRAAGIDLRTGTRAVGIDLAAREVEVVAASGEETLAYDELVIATGAEVVVPPWARDDAGALRPGVAPVKTLDDGAHWRHLLDDAALGRTPVRAAVVGGGYIGLEMAEALLRRRCEVDLFASAALLPGFDPVIAERMRETVQAAGVRVHEHQRVSGLAGGDGAPFGVEAADGGAEADLLVLATGVRPVTDLGIRGGDLPTGAAGAFDPDDTQRLAPGVWTAGDCSTVAHRLLGRRVHLALGTHANKQGRVLGTNLGGGSARSAGALGTAITRFAVGEHHLEVARTGLGVEEAREAGYDPVALLTEGTTASGYMPQAGPAAVHVVADAGSGRLLGMQIAGGEGAAKRIDTAAAVLWTAGTVHDLAEMDLAYAPPFATVWELVQIAARRLADRL